MNVHNGHISILDNQDDSMAIYINGQLVYGGDMSCFGNYELSCLLRKILPTTEVTLTQNAENFDRVFLDDYPNAYELHTKMCHCRGKDACSVCQPLTR